MRSLALVFLLVSTPNLYSNPGAQEEKFADCLLAIRLADLHAGPTLISSELFRYQSHSFMIPTKLRPLAEKISLLDIREDVKQSYLLALQDMTGTKNVLNSAVSEGWQAALNKRLIAGQKEIPANAKDVTIVVHQKADWQDATADFIDTDPLLSKIPVISLNSPTFPMRSGKLLAKTDQLRWSENGEMDNIPATVQNFHLLGGWCTKCMSKAVRDIIESRVALKQNAPIDVFVYSSLSYTPATTENPSLASQIHGKSKYALMDSVNIDSIARGYPGGATAGPPVFVETAHGPAYCITIKGREYDLPLKIYIVAK